MRNAGFVMAIVGLSLTTPAYAWFEGNNSDNQVATPVAQPNPEILDLVTRMEQMQSEVQQLRGMIEEQSQTISDLQRKQKNMYLDLDSRIQNASSAVTPTSPTTSVAPVGATPAVAAPVATQPAVVSPAQAPQLANNDKDRYQQAYEALRSGQNAMAVKLFESFLQDFPSGQFADNAQYWLAEAYKVNREIDKSRSAFIKVLTQYPQSAKVPDALLKLGYIEFELQNIPKSREYLTQVVNAFPGTPAANLAAKKLAVMP
jgi:tol-pal system protein YbgF